MTFTLHWPQMLYLAMCVAGLCLETIRHGKPKTEKYDIWTSLIAQTLIWALLWWGGFFGSH